MFDIAAVKALFHQAAEIERRSARVGPSTGRIQWQIERDDADRADWNAEDEQVLARHRRSISREERAIRDQVEAFIVSLRNPRAPQDHELITAWFLCRVRRRSFSQHIRSSRWSIATVYRRLDRIFDQIARQANKAAVSIAA